MVAFLGNISTFESLATLLIMCIPFFLGCWLLIEIIRWLRRKK